MSQFLSGKEINPGPIRPDTTITELIDSSFEAYNAARLREACHLFVKKMLADPDVDVITICTPSGAHLEPAIAAARAASRQYREPGTRSIAV